MPRPIKPRIIGNLPNVSYFKPQGIPLALLEEVILNVEELEAIRLKDLEDLEQEKAAKKMNVSRGTFQRILNSARQKIADALINGKAIRIEGGYFEIKQTGKGFGYRKPKFCVCSVCGYAMEKVAAKPCSSLRCPKCGAIMIRKEI